MYRIAWRVRLRRVHVPKYFTQILSSSTGKLLSGAGNILSGKIQGLGAFQSVIGKLGTLGGQGIDSLLNGAVTKEGEKVLGEATHIDNNGVISTVIH
jgi:hypothetical protein